MVVAEEAASRFNHSSASGRSIKRAVRDRRSWGSTTRGIRRGAMTTEHAASGSRVCGAPVGLHLLQANAGSFAGGPHRQVVEIRNGVGQPVWAERATLDVPQRDRPRRLDDGGKRPGTRLRYRHQRARGWSRDSRATAASSCPASGRLICWYRADECPASCAGRTATCK